MRTIQSFFPRILSSLSQSSFAMRIRIAGTLIVAGGMCFAPALSAQFEGTYTVVESAAGVAPTGVAVDRNGNVYFSDTANNQVLKETLSGGSYTQSVVANSTSNGLLRPWGVAVDKSGNVYIADVSNSRILKETLSGSTYTQSVVADATTNGISGAVGVAVDASGNVYIANTAASNVLKEALSGGVYTQSVVANSTNGLLGPGSVAVDPSGNVYIADINNSLVVKETLSSGAYTQSVVANAASNGLNEAYGIAVDGNGNVFICDFLNLRLLEEVSNAGTYTQRTIVGLLNEPTDVAIGPDGGVYVTGSALFANASTEQVLKLGLNAALGPVNVGGPGTTPTEVFFTASSAGTIGSVAVLTDGVSGLDFTNAGTGTCKAGLNYTAGQSCSVSVTFTPKVPGPRKGAVEVLDPSGNVLGTVYIHGRGVGPQAAFRYLYGSGVPTPVISSPDITAGDYLAVDGAGDLFLTNNEAPLSAHVANGSIVEFPVSGSGFGTPIVLASALPFPQGVAVDGAGNLYVLFDADKNYTPSTGSIVSYEKTATGYAPAVIIASGLSYPNGLAIDGEGNLFFAQYSDPLNSPNSGGVFGIVQGGGSPVTLADGLSYPADVALDADDDVFVTLISNSTNGANSGSVVELKNTSTGYSSPVTIASGLSYASGVSVDPSGALLVTTSANSASAANSGSLIEYPYTSSGFGAPVTLSDGFNIPSDVKTDSAGNILVLDYGTDLYRIPRTSAPSITYAATAVGSTSSDSPKTVTLENIGNGSLTFPIPATGENPSISSNFTLNSSVTSACPLLSSSSSLPGTLAAGASCLLPISFSPTTTGSLNGSLVLTDNSLNVSGATQSIALSGTGTTALAQLTSPAPGSMLSSSSVTFTWSAGVGATDYELWVGSTGAGSSNLFYPGLTTSTSESVTGLPTNGETLYVRLYSKISGAWKYNDYTYKAEGEPAVLTSPTPDSTLTGSSTTFTWSAGTGATDYELWVGTTGVGSSNVFYPGLTTSNSEAVTGLPTDAVTLYVRLYSKIGGTWQYRDYTYTAAGGTAAVLTTPTPGGALTSSSVAFSWSGGEGVTDYELWVGTTGVGSSNLNYPGLTTATTETVTGLPTSGVTLYVRLYSKVSGAWQYHDYTYLAGAEPATLSSPAPGSTLTSSSVDFTWSGGIGVTEYELWVGTTGVGSSNINYPGATTTTSETVSGLPSSGGGTVYVRLYSKINGAWQYHDYTYTAE